MSETVKFVLDEPRHPDALGQPDGRPARPANPAAAADHPGTKQPAGPDDLAPLFPMALILQEVSAEPEIEIPEPVRDAYKLWRPTPLYRARRLERALDTPAHIYYKYEGVSPRRVAQAEHRGRPGVRERAGRDQEADDRDRRRPVGLGARVRVPAVRARVRGVDGRLELRPEALPPLDDGDLGRDRPPLALGRHRVRRARRRTPPGRSGSRSPRRSRSPPRTPTRTTRSARCSTTCCCTRP